MTFFILPQRRKDAKYLWIAQRLSDFAVFLINRIVIF